MRGDPKGADDFWLAGFDVILRDAEAVFLVERENQRDKLFIADTGAEFAIEQVASSLGQRRLVNFVNGLMERFDVEQGVMNSREFPRLSGRYGPRGPRVEWGG